MLSSLAALIAFALCCYGWGRAAHALCYPAQAPLHAFSVGLGLVVLCFFGGILNGAHLAVPLALAICAYCGIILAVVFLVRTARAGEWRALFSRTTIAFWSCAVVVAGLGLFLTMVLLPSQIFDYADDFFSYLVRPVRMLATGTVGGNPFELLGLSDFGAQSFLNGILLTWLPLNDAYAFDTVFCFLLGICLLFEQGRSKAAPVASIALAIAVYVAVNPQIANISSVYSTAVLILTLATATTVLLDAWEQEGPLPRLILVSIPVGAIAATLAAIKLTTVLFVLPFCAIVIGVLLVKRFRVAAVVAIVGIGSGGVTDLGWLITHLDKLQMSSWSSSARFYLDPGLTIWPSLLEAFRDRPTLYGGTRAIYFIGVVVLALSLAASILRFSRRPRELNPLVMIAAMSGGIASYVGLAAIFNNEAALRYAVPFLIALVPYTLFGGAPVPHAANGRSAPLIQTGPSLWIVGIQLIFLITFFRPDEVRLSRMIDRHTVVSIPISEQNRADQARALSDEARASLRSMQAKVPAGATIWAWVDAPFDLDFARNRVWNYHMDWSVAPWRLNARTVAELRGELESRGVNYVLWQYRSDFNPDVATMQGYLQSVQWPEYRIILRSAIELSLSLGVLAKQSDIVWDDGATMLIALKPASR
jgi:hypothetical protein